VRVGAAVPRTAGSSRKGDEADLLSIITSSQPALRPACAQLTRDARGGETNDRLATYLLMALDFETLAEGSPAYGVVDARDGVVLYARPGHEDEFDALASEVLDSAGEAFEVIPISDGPRCDRLFVAPLREERSFQR
jgi:hypothetical protein